MSRKTIIKHSLLSVFGLGGASLAAIVSNILVARSFPIEEVGEYFSANALAVWISAFAAIGLPDLLIREFREGSLETPSVSKKILGQLFCCVLVLVLFGTFIIWCITKYNPVVSVVASAPLLAVPIRLIAAKYRIQSKYQLVLLTLLCVNIIKLGVIFTGWVLAWNFLFFCLALASTFYVFAVIAWGALLVDSIKTPNCNIGSLREGLPYFFSGVVGVGRSSLDIVLISSFLGPAAAAIYQPATFPAKRSRGIGQAICDTVMFPRLMKIAQKSTGRFKRKAWTMTIYIVILGILIACLFAFLGSFFLNLYGPDYLTAKPYYYALVALIPVKFALSSLTSSLKHKATANGRAMDQLISLVVLVLLISTLAPAFGLWGGVISIIASDILLFCLFVIRLHRLTHFVPPVK